MLGLRPTSYNLENHKIELTTSKNRCRSLEFDDYSFDFLKISSNSCGFCEVRVSPLLAPLCRSSRTPHTSCVWALII
ncbi:hypothetical protein HanPSC8_Chr03g0097781 [Helianthus annuus]|uniref:Uncharacterized protein n=1 Tax=Helianthus annuus TaxID=4232 RepID=A0A251V6G8_HELAN|nr:hypothetical protein HanPSC8_Chr03g0097781 [Helianthus annuus]